MQKVYRLLRNNQETGPYSLDEILQLHLKPFDLVWVEGRSAAWRYPSEIETLKSYVPAAPQPETPFEPVSTAAMETGVSSLGDAVKKTVSKNVFVSMPGQPTQPRPAEQPERPARIQEPMKPVATESISPYAGVTTEPEVIHTNYARTLNDVEEDYANWMYKHKTRKKSGVSRKDLVVTAIILALIIGGYFIISKPSIVEPLSLQKQTAPSFSVKENLENPPIEQNSVPSTVAAVDEKKKTEPKTKRPGVNIEGAKIENPGETQTEKVINSEEIPNNVSEPSHTPTQKENGSVKPKEKKKKLGEVIRGIFVKKDKKEPVKNETVKKEPVEEDPPPATNRHATRRNTETEENSDKMSSESLAAMIDISSNAPDNWMMGVSALKVTLRNRSNVVIQTATVQVLYYDENDQVIDRKNIYFNNVPAKGKLTLGAPDHKFADHVDLILAAANAREDRYANN